MLRDWWVHRRNATLASPAFQRFALRSPLLRPIAQRRARQLFDLVAGFTYTQTLFACAELGLFRSLSAGPQTLAWLSATCDLSEPALDRLVGAAEAIGLLQRLDRDRIALGPIGAALLGNPGVLAMIAHHRQLYADLADPVGLLRQRGGGRLAEFWAYARGDEAKAVAEYSELMAASIRPVARELLDAYDVAKHRKLLDIGGGEGRFLAEVQQRAPKLELGLLDLPAVVERARARLDQTVNIYGGDFSHDPLPGGYDCMTLVRVLHDHDDNVALGLLRAINRGLVPGGTLLIAEPMLDAAGARPVGATYFAWYLRAMGQGRARSRGEIAEMLAKAGFATSCTLATRLPLTTSVIKGVKAV